MKTYFWIVILSTITMLLSGTSVLLDNGISSVVALGFSPLLLHLIGLFIFPNQQEMREKKSVENNMEI